MNQHCSINVGQYDMAGRADPLSEFPGEVAGAAREIKYDVTFANAGLIDRVALPQTV